MIIFNFCVNKSFLEYSSHSITIPQNNYQNLVEYKLDKGDFTLIFPKGEVLKGYIYLGCSSWGKYYQIRTRGKQDFPKYLLSNNQLLVILFSHNEKSYCVLEYKQ
ncbi:MAG TPA: hypothetical protein P5268_09290 [Candidatus Marinimicrobia bacterium]|nr:hypothetical protein [Candidatus Neomarinimicrobiota bacterium]HRU93209.1 hypothetical protein [Candidatus Neomarinimicrobiota bacterium]